MFIGRTCQTRSQEEPGNQALQGMGPGTGKLPAAVTWSFPGLQFLSNLLAPVTPPHYSPGFSSQIPGGLLAPPTIRHQAVRGVTSLPKNWLPSGTNLMGASHSFSVTPILLNSPWHTGPQEEGVSPLDHGKGCTSSRNKDALQAPWG